MELLNLQSSLQSEIQAKQSIGEELSKTRSELVATQKYVMTNMILVILNELCWIENILSLNILVYLQTKRNIGYLSFVSK